jgi:hypothetical protein
MYMACVKILTGDKIAIFVKSLLQRSRPHAPRSRVALTAAVAFVSRCKIKTASCSVPVQRASFINNRIAKAFFMSTSEKQKMQPNSMD